MSGYTRIAEGDFFRENAGGITASKFFINVTGGTDSLPLIGEPYSDQVWNAICHDKLRTFIGKDTRRELWEIQYSDKVSVEEASDDDTKAEDLRKNYDWGAEVLNVGKQAGVVWTTSNEAFDVPLFKRVNVSNLTIIKVFPSFDDMDDKLTAYGGKVNDAEFLGRFGIGRVLLKGAKTSEIARTNLTVGSTNDLQGSRWKATLSFAVRGGHADVAQEVPLTWQHIWNKKTKLWDTITDTDNADNTLPFQVADIGKILET